MPTMRKEDVIGFSVNPFPRNLLSFFGKSPDLFLLWIFCDGFFVALQADTRIGHSGKVLGLKITVTGVTLQPLFDMFLMVERDRLSGPEANAQTDEDEEYQDPRRQSDKE
jgi:hypothetical protein